MGVMVHRANTEQIPCTLTQYISVGLRKYKLLEI